METKKTKKKNVTNKPAVINKIAQTKKAIVSSLKKNLGIISAACHEVGISRSTYYNYLEDDKEFKKEVDHIAEEAIDFVESKLYELIDSGDTTAAIFYLKTKGKNRGYTEKLIQEITADINVPRIVFTGDSDD